LYNSYVQQVILLMKTKLVQVFDNTPQIKVLEFLI